MTYLELEMRNSASPNLYLTGSLLSAKGTQMDLDSSVYVNSCGEVVFSESRTHNRLESLDRPVLLTPLASVSDLIAILQ